MRESLACPKPKAKKVKAKKGKKSPQSKKPEKKRKYNKTRRENKGTRLSSNTTPHPYKIIYLKKTSGSSIRSFSHSRKSLKRIRQRPDSDSLSPPSQRNGSTRSDSGSSAKTFLAKEDSVLVARLDERGFTLKQSPVQ